MSFSELEGINRYKLLLTYGMGVIAMYDIIGMHNYTVTTHPLLQLIVRQLRTFIAFIYTKKIISIFAIT